MQKFEQLLWALGTIELWYREKEILKNLTIIQQELNVPENYLCFWLFDINWDWFQATFRDGKLSITN